MSDLPATPCCPGCGTELAPSLLSCPACRRLVHADELKRCAADAAAAAHAGNLLGAITHWRRALDLLPPGTMQYNAVAAEIDGLTRKQETAAGPATPAPADAGPISIGRKGRAPTLMTAAGALALLVWKLKFVLGFLLTKGKLLLLGLTKASTFFSMILSLGVYWTAWGWKFALGLILSIYIHEIGHVAALRRLGIKATAPMFVPGLGAVVRLKQYPASPREDARVGLAGPLWGLAAAVGAYAVYWATGWESWAAIAKVGAWINLFNLLPVWQLDGSRGFRALARSQRWLVVAAIGAMWYLTAEGLLALVFIVAVLRTLGTEPAEQPDRTALIQYAFLVVALAALAQLKLASASI
jgi:Zn-dependent protease